MGTDKVYYLHQGGYAFGSVCVHVSLSVCKHESLKRFEWILIKLCRIAEPLKVRE